MHPKQGQKLYSITEDEWKNQIYDKLKIKIKLINARVKKYRKKKCTESQQLNSSMQNDPTEVMQNKQVRENNAERKRAMAKERSRRFCERNALMS